MYKVIRSYLENGDQRVLLSGKLSYINICNWGTITYGVPQGSILDLLDFLLYVNNLPKLTNFENTRINLKTILFADDTSVIVSNPNITDLEWNLNWVFKKMNEWFNRNSLSLNFSTTCFMQFHSKNNLLQ